MLNESCRLFFSLQSLLTEFVLYAQLLTAIGTCYHELRKEQKYIYLELTYNWSLMAGVKMISKYVSESHVL